LFVKPSSIQHEGRELTNFAELIQEFFSGKLVEQEQADDSPSDYFEVAALI